MVVFLLIFGRNGGFFVEVVVFSLIFRRNGVFLVITKIKNLVSINNSGSQRFGRVGGIVCVV